MRGIRKSQDTCKHDYLILSLQQHNFKFSQTFNYIKIKNSFIPVSSPNFISPIIGEYSKRGSEKK
jgi:hypothetical protein